MNTAITTTTTTTASTAAAPTSTPLLPSVRTVTRHTQRLHTACQFLHSALGQRIHMDLDIPVQDFLRQFQLLIRRAPANGHCLLYSWAMSTNTSVETVKQQLLHEFNSNYTQLYFNAAIKRNELNSYIQSHNYTLNAVDAVVDILCNATHTTAFIVGQKYDYTNPQNIEFIANTMEIRIISPQNSQSLSQILLIKSFEHYDSLA